MLRRYDNYKVLNPAGVWETWRIPRFVNPSDVAKHRPHCTVCMFVPKGYVLYGKSEFGESVKMEGPCWTVWNREKQEHVGPFKDPETIPWRTLWVAEGLQAPEEVTA